MTEKQINARAKSTDAFLNCKQNIKIDGCALSRTEKPSSRKTAFETGSFNHKSI